MTWRVGNGYDVHRYSDDPARKLRLGGIELPDEQGLEGHSDADVVAHALADAMLGAAGLGDLGSHFPDDDPTLEGADSIDLLSRVARLVRSAGWRLANADCTVVLERPSLSPHRAAMSERLTDAAQGPVSVKAKRPEGMGALGREEGVACWSIALLETDG